MHNSNKEVITIRGMAAAIQAMNYPKLDAVNEILDDVGYILICMKEFTFSSFGKDFKTYKEAHYYASITILTKQLDVSIEECITIYHKVNNGTSKA